MRVVTLLALWVHLLGMVVWLGGVLYQAHILLPMARRANAGPFADETVRVEWLVIKVTPHARLGGDIVDLRGRIRGQDGHTAVGAKGRVLVADRL